MKSKKTRECVERLAKENKLTQGQVLDIIKSQYTWAYQKVSNPEYKVTGKFPTVPLIGFGKIFHSKCLAKVYKRYHPNIENNESIPT